MWKWIVTGTLTVVVLTGACLLWLWQDMEASLLAPLSIHNEVLIDMRPGMTVSSLARDLADREILHHPEYLIFEARRKKLAHRMQRGEYRLTPGMNARDLLALLVTGRVTQYRITFIEGWSFNRILAELASHDKIVQKLDGRDDDEIMAMLGYPDTHPEGRFFPDTYTFTSGTLDTNLLRRAHVKMQRVLAEQWRDRSGDLPYESPYDALIMASIIEKETGLAAERELIAAVFVERLRKGMRLQTDPTVIYGLGPMFDGNLRRADLQNDTPYKHLYPPRFATHADCHARC